MAEWNIFSNEKPESVIPLEVKRAQEDIYKNPAVVQMAEECKAGKVSAMREMADFFRNRCTPPLLSLLDQYEAAPSLSQANAIRQYLKEHFHAQNTARGYMMWLVRAAIYGDETDRKRIENWPFYKEYAFFSYGMMTGTGERYKSVWASNFLRKVGFIDAPENLEDCGVSYLPEKKIFAFSYVSDYIPADETGFGSETDYAYLYFDEFFRRLDHCPEKN